MLILISDACVLIDIENGDLTHAMFSLPYQFCVPDILFSEELEEHHAHLISLGLIKKPMDGTLIEETSQLFQQYSRTSFHDLLALILAKNEQGLLLTGDKALRSVANKFNIQVHGTIWLVEQMLCHKKINVKIAKSAFQKIKVHGGRLPWNEVQKMLEKYDRANLYKQPVNF